MTFRVVVLSQARRDIDRNADWWAEHHSVEQSVQWSDAVYDQIETLADFPESTLSPPRTTISRMKSATGWWASVPARPTGPCSRSGTARFMF
ncbi:MAG: type II toxin-antitoxin system RelE/ParE family toxin [Planctomycetaceae bacterium]|nr:type II toxin-antitoxin system RelE/ParE family toxin [Planctomycetaceae bacterium]